MKNAQNEVLDNLIIEFIGKRLSKKSKNEIQD